MSFCKNGVVVLKKSRNRSIERKYDSINGYKLIEMLKSNPEKFCYGYQLYEEYRRGLDLNTLHLLLHTQNNEIKRVAIWILSELGTYGGDILLNDALELLNDEDSYIVSYAYEIVANCAYDDDYMKLFEALAHKDQKIRIDVMSLFGVCPDFRLRQILEYLDRKSLSLYQECIAFLLKADIIEEADIMKMLNSNNSIKRKFAIIMAGKVYYKYPEIINKSIFNEDEDIRYYSELKMKVEKTYNRRL